VSLQSKSSFNNLSSTVGDGEDIVGSGELKRKESNLSVNSVSTATTIATTGTVSTLGVTGANVNAGGDHGYASGALMMQKQKGNEREMGLGRSSGHLDFLGVPESELHVIGSPRKPQTEKNVDIGSSAGKLNSSSLALPAPWDSSSSSWLDDMDPKNVSFEDMMGRFKDLW
jgi:hypothetical protein